MRHTYKLLLFTILTATVLACGAIPNPLGDTKSLEATAQAMASAIPSGLPAMPTGLPALPTGLPNFDQYMNPQGKPVPEWNAVPVMSQAVAGQEFDKNTYSYRVSGVTQTDVQNFYDDKLKALGWSSGFGIQGGGTAGVMVFTKETQFLTIAVTPSDKDLVVVLLLT